MLSNFIVHQMEEKCATKTIGVLRSMASDTFRCKQDESLCLHEMRQLKGEVNVSDWLKAVVLQSRPDPLTGDGTEEMGGV